MTEPTAAPPPARTLAQHTAPIARCRYCQAAIAPAEQEPTA
jgi:hypothetical protein